MCIRDSYDPIVTTDAAVGVLRTRLMEKARQLDPCLSIHDLRIVPGDTQMCIRDRYIGAKAAASGCAALPAQGNRSPETFAAAQ